MGWSEGISSYAAATGATVAPVPEITEAGETLRAAVADACAGADAAVPRSFSPDHVQVLRRMLFGIIGDGEDRGSCL